MNIKRKNEINKSVIKTMAVLAVMIVLWSVFLSGLKHYSHERYCQWFGFSPHVQNDRLCYSELNKDRLQTSGPKNQ